ncbi:MAG TPA: outer membrane lipoprotein chaperone LolA, partial [Stenotrophobium sp.]|nr:outer membrane lipoprotein chaperone LolA [Stenotrophobium sp.]
DFSRNEAGKSCSNGTMNIKNFLIGLALVLSSGAAHAGEARNALGHFVNDVQNLNADFKQVQTDEHGRVLQTTTGHMWLSRPGRFRWDYQTPYKQLIVCDGHKIWVYDEDLAQVTTRSATATLEGTPAALLSNRKALSDEFTVEDAGRSAGAQVIRLKPKSADSDFKAIDLTLDQGTPQHMTFVDELGGRTEVTFSNIQLNHKPDAGLFHFTAPRGVEVIDSADTAPAP